MPFIYIKGFYKKQSGKIFDSSDGSSYMNTPFVVDESAGTKTYEIQSTIDDDGEYYIQVVAKDYKDVEKVSNLGSQGNPAFKLDTSPPTTAITSPMSSKENSSNFSSPTLSLRI